MRESLFLIALSLFVSGSAINSRAQDLQVIKDSEAAQYVGKNVEVRGLVVAVYTSKKGNTFLNFGSSGAKRLFIVITLQEFSDDKLLSS